MTMPDRANSVLVLLIGEVLEDPRVLKTCRSLAASGASVTVVCTNPSNRIARETADGIEIMRVPHYRESFAKRLYNTLQRSGRSSLAGTAARLHEETPSSRTAALVRNAGVMLNHRHVIRETGRIGRQMLEAVGVRHFDLVHANDVDTLAVGAALKSRGNARELLYDAHEYWAGMGQSEAVNRRYDAIQGQLIRVADYVVTVNPLIAERLRDDYRLPSLPAVVMNCPHRGDEPVEMVSHDPVRVIYQGRLQAYRGLDALIRAFTHTTRAVLTLSGDGAFEERLRALSDTLGLAGRVTFTGRYRPVEASGILRGHDVGIIPYEDVILNNRFSSPNKLFEYMMAGLAVAARRLPFIERVVAGNDAGVMFDECEPAVIAAALDTLAADPGRLTDYRKHARAAALAEYTWETQFNRHYPWKIR